MRHRTKALTGAFFFAWIFAAAPATGADTTAGCLLDGKGEPAVVAHVHDGDTLMLHDGRRLRLLGIDTPELDPEAPARSEPLALAARDRLRQLAPKGTVLLLYRDQVGQDRHGRELVQALRADQIDLAATLLTDGLARQLVVPPNDRLWRCYQRLQHEARRQRKGLWALPAYQPTPADKLTEASAAQGEAGGKGWHVLDGRIQSLREQRGDLLIELGSRLTLRIRAADRPAFRALSLTPGQRLLVSGRPRWHQGRARIDLKHPSALLTIGN